MKPLKRKIGLSLLPFAFFLLIFTFLFSPSLSFAESHIYVDQAVGVNSSSTTGTETDPFKSITYALLVAENYIFPDPWVVHIKAGTYDADPAKPANEREIFPITLRNGMTIQGDDGAESCIISGAYNPNSNVALIYGNDLTDITIKDLTLTGMQRSSGYGAGTELQYCSGEVKGCIISNNACGGSGGGIYLIPRAGGTFTFEGNRFMNDSSTGSYHKGGGVYITGNDFNGSIINNIFETNSAYYGGGICCDTNFIGDIQNNSFINNSSFSPYINYSSGFYFSGSTFTGAISENIFIGNNHRVFYVNGTITGEISDNIFFDNYGNFYVGSCKGKIDGNIFSYNSTSGRYGGFELGSGSTNAIISNNFFLYNKGSAFYSGQNVTVINNTFYSGAAGESAANITSSASGSIFKDNIFANLDTAILEETELDLVITHNDFYNLTNILNRNNQDLGNDIFYIYLLLNNFTLDNKDWAPGLIGEDLETGSWTADPVYDPVNNYTILTDSTKSWVEGKWVGAMVNISQTTSVRKHMLITGNSSTQIMVQGDITSLDLLSYNIDDYRLAEGSSNIDTGTVTVASFDYEKDVRPQGSLYDIGADEFFTGTIQSYTITATNNTGGAINPAGNVTVFAGMDRTFTITPNIGFHISDVTVDSASKGVIETYTFSNVSANHAIHADFSQDVDQYIITATCGEGGVISPSGSVVVTPGGNQTFNITPNEGFKIQFVFVDGFYVGDMSSYMFQDVYRNHTIQVIFKEAAPSSISCAFSINAIILGEPLEITGQITPQPTDSGSFVDIALIPPSGPEIHHSVIANVLGEFSYDLDCEDIDMAGTWHVQTSWSGDDNLQAAASDIQTLEVTKASTRLTLDVTSYAIKIGDTVSISGKLTPQPDCGANLSGIDITLNIDGPGGISDTQTVQTNDQWGHFILQDYAGFNSLGDWTVQAAFNGNDAYLAKTSDTVNVRVAETAGYAIIIEGKHSSGAGLESHNKTANFVYKTLKDRGFSDDDIIYFNYVSQTGVDASPTKSAISNAITIWAADMMDPNYDNPNTGPENEVIGKPANLYIIMVDHGLNDIFYIYPDSVTSADLGGWLDTLQSSLTGQAAEQEIVVMLGFCRSGSFIDELSGSNRVIISSTAANESSYKGPLDQDNIREGEYFVSEFFKRVSLGKTIKSCFEDATRLTEAFTSSRTTGSTNAPYYDYSRQHPLLDDNGDGIGSNDLSGQNADGALSEEITIGVSSITGNDPGDVSIEEVAPTIFLGESDTSTDGLWASVDDNTRLLNIWVEIKPPDYDPIDTEGSEQIEMELYKAVSTSYNETENRWEWPGLGGFDDPGTYQVFYFAKDDITGNVSPFIEGTVYKAMAGNNPPGSFDLLGPSDGEETATTLVLMWTSSIDPDDDPVTYTVEISEDPDFASFAHRIEGVINNSYFAGAEAGLQDLTTYYWRVIAVDQYGSQTISSEIRSFNTDNTNGIPGFLIGIVVNLLGQGIGGAGVTTSVASTTTYNNGIYMMSLPSGTYTINVTATGYDPQSSSEVAVIAEKQVTYNFVLISQGDSDEDGFDDEIDNCPNIYNPEQTDTDGDETGDACDGCPNDPSKTSPGACGCGMADTDTDSDGTMDCIDTDDDDDGMPDEWEEQYGLNPLVNDASADPDKDGYTNLQEYREGGDPNNSDTPFPWELFLPAITGR